jgi:uncharacterized protein with HEPN domain
VSLGLSERHPGGYGNSRLIRSAVERELIIIGEALKLISKRNPQLFAAIPEGR